MVSVIQDAAQSKMTDYFEIVDKIIPVINDSNESDRLHNNLNEMGYKDSLLNLKSFLRALVEYSEKNHMKSKYHFRYLDFLKDVSMYLFILGGRKLYEILSINLGLPSTSSMKKINSKFESKNK